MAEDVSPVYYCDSCSVARASYLIKLLDGEILDVKETVEEILDLINEIKI